MSVAKESTREAGFPTLANKAEPEKMENFAEALGMRGVCMETLFVMVLGNNIFDLLEWILLFTEDIQIMYGVFPHEADSTTHNFPLPMWLGFVFNPLAPRVYETYSVYIQWFSLTLFAILFWGCNGAYVAYTVYRGTYVVWPLHSFRLLSAFFPSVLFIPMVEMLLTAVLDCAYKSDGHLTLVTGEIVLCLSGFHLVTYGFAILFLLFFIPVSIFLAFNFVSTDPTYKMPSSRAHGRCDAAFAVLKVFLMVITRVFAESLFVSEFSVLFVSTAMCFIINRYRPHYNNLVNNCRIASFTSVSIFALLVFILRKSQFDDKNGAVAIVIAGICVTWVIAFVFSAYIYRRRCACVQQRLKEVESLTGHVQTNYLVFDHWPSVEIACRFITDGMDDRRRAFDESKAPLVHTIFKRGVQEFPNVPFVHLSYHLYSNYLRSGGTNLYPLSATKGLKPAFDVAFFIYMNEGLEDRQQQMTDLGSHVDLKVTEFAEYKKLEKAAKFNHEKARQVMRIFWNVISKDSTQRDAVSDIVSDVQVAVDEADKSYRRLLQMYPASVSINRSYGSFLIEVKQEPETAESYIQRSEDLETRALANKKEAEYISESDDLGFLSDHDIKETDEKSEHSLRRSTSESSSRVSSNSNQAARRLSVKQNMRLAADRRIKRFITGSSIFILTGIGIIIGSNVVLENILLDEDLQQNYGRTLRRRLYLCDETFLILRRMRMAAIAADEGEFQFQRSRLVAVNTEYQQKALSSYSNLPNTNGMEELQAMYETPMFNNIRVIYPANITVVEKITLFQFSEQFGIKAASLLDLGFNSFAHANMTSNENFRYILDNFYGLQTSFTNNKDLYSSRQLNSQNAYQKDLWAFSGALCVLFVCGVGYIIEFWFRDMREHHMKRLDLFKKIPKSMRTAIRDSLDTSAEESATSFQLPNLSAHIQPYDSLRKFRKRAFVFLTCTCAMSCAFVLNGQFALTDVYILAAVINPMGELRTRAVQVDLYVTEMVVQDVPTTWQTSSMIYSHFNDSLNSFSSMMDEIIYPGVDAVGLSQVPGPMHAIWFEPSCLSANASICATPHYNYDIGFTPAVAKNGLGILLSEYRNAATAIANTAKDGILDANDPHALFIRSAKRYYLTDGLVRLVELGVDSLHEVIQHNMVIINLIFYLQLSVAILGYIFVLLAMKKWYRERDDATNLVFTILPPSAVKSDPDIEEFLKTGILVEQGVSEVSDVMRLRSRNSTLKKDTELGSRVSLMVNTIRRASFSTSIKEDIKERKDSSKFSTRRTSFAQSLKDEISEVKDNSSRSILDAKLKKLHFEEQSQVGGEPPENRRMSGFLSPVRSDPYLSRSYPKLKVESDLQTGITEFRKSISELCTEEEGGMKDDEKQEDV